MAASKALRAWIGLVGATAILSGLQCFINEQYPRNRIYSMRPDQGELILAHLASYRPIQQTFISSLSITVTYVRSVDIIGGNDTAGIRNFTGHWKVL